MLKALSTILLLGLLAGMALRALLPRRPAPSGHRVETARKCPVCGAYRLGDGQCPTPGCRARG